MTTTGDAYLLSGGAAQLERLRLQAQVWEPAAEDLLDWIGVEPGWRCLEMGCGAMGILGPLSQRVGSAVLALQDRHPYMRLPVQFGTQLRQRIIDGGLLSADELDEQLAACEAIAADSSTWVTTPIVTQVWGRLAQQRDRPSA